MTGNFLDVSPEEYFKIPAFSATVAKELITRTPAHARQRMIEGKEPTREMDFGSVVHALVLGKGKAFKVVEAKDWRTKDAQTERTMAYEERLVPILTAELERAREVASQVLASISAASRADARIRPALDGASEQAMTWVEETESGPLPCKGMLDHVWIERGLILDLKFGADASPAFIERQAENLGHPIQWAAYTSGFVKALPVLDGRVRFLFLFAEVKPPYVINIVEPDGMFREIGTRRWRRAVETWARCLKTNDYPAYGAGINTISSPPWALSREAAAFIENEEGI